MEILLILVYAGVLGLAAPYVYVRSDNYGSFVPTALALISGSILLPVLTWAGVGITNPWTWLIVMSAMPAVMVIGSSQLAAKRKHADEQLLIKIKTSGSPAATTGAVSGEQVYITE